MKKPTSLDRARGHAAVAVGRSAGIGAKRRMFGQNTPIRPPTFGPIITTAASCSEESLSAFLSMYRAEGTWDTQRRRLSGPDPQRPQP